jgi:hypothetical protein
MPAESLHDVAVQARAAVIGLTELLEKQKRVARRRLLWVTAIYVPVAMMISGFVTIGLVSTCFLGTSGEPPRACNWMPGYTEALESDTEIIKEFRQLQKITQENRGRIQKLERRVNG